MRLSGERTTGAGGKPQWTVKAVLMDLADLISDAALSTRADAIVAADRDGIIRFWNPGAERIFGHSRADCVGQSLDLIIPPRLRQRHWGGYEQVMLTGETRYGEADVLSVPAVRKDGVTISVEFTIMLLRQEGQIVGIAAIMRDVTVRFRDMQALRGRLAELEGAATKPIGQTTPDGGTPV